MGKVLESQLYPNKNKHTDLSQAEHHGGPSSSLGVLQDKTHVHVHWVKTDGGCDSEGAAGYVEAVCGACFTCHWPWNAVASC